ncbi:FMN-linked oxidoreductase [Amniculicola lignicola CBS 123094]|uniref:FMN-linked oxidoreductase n=1 Tax=Amniculicola lignicola CBS 123094 TaxID=1392246 RepID=A0A6A5WPY6_9PLEO|nr:FMN-linked oxidoreductase [Amniculicola lignicola CBS 123094]
MAPQSRLFKPLKLGNVTLGNRIAMAPLTRWRNTDDHVSIQPMVAEYYAQRASVPGTLIVTEALIIAPEHDGYNNSPGIYKPEQIDAWKQTVEAVHRKGSFIFAQLWALGRVAVPSIAEKNGFPVISSSPVSLGEGYSTPKEMTEEDIKRATGQYVQAAKNAIEAGFDGVEIHGANGYLIDQFLQDTVNKRTDSYGGSVANRSRFAVEVTKAVVDAVGADRTAIRLSPFSEFQGMKMSDPFPQFKDVTAKLNTFGLAYVHYTEARVSGNADVDATESLDPFLDLYTSGPVLLAGGFKPESAYSTADEQYKGRDVVVVFGRYFISNPDLVYRVQEGIDFTPYDRDLFYNAKEARGYTDWAFSKEFLAANL